MIIWAKVRLPEELVRRFDEHRAFSCDEPVRDPSLTYEIGRTTGGHFAGDGTLHVQIELDEKALIARLAERRGAF